MSPLDDPTVRELEPALLRMAQRAVRDRVLAGDLVQASFLALLESPGGFQAERGTLRGYLMGILTRKIADHFRRMKRAALDPDSETQIASLGDLRGDPGARLFHPIDARRAMQVVETVLESLSPPQRLAILACDVEQIERSEAAAALGITEGNLRVMLHRGRHTLRKALEDAGLR